MPKNQKVIYFKIKAYIKILKKALYHITIDKFYKENHRSSSKERRGNPMHIPYTEIANIVLRDSSLSLSCKGLYAMLYSYAGLPNFQLTLHRLECACSSSTYALRKAWRELKESGYLQHYYTTLENGAFSHAYDIHQDMQTDAGTMRYTHAMNRPNGNVRPVRSNKTGDYTAVCDTVLRDKTLTLQTKGLYAVLTYLFRIPNFSFRLQALAGLCLEKTKALASAWNKIKLCGLLKQHRHPCGEHNQFQYTYDLLHTPDTSKPYFTNHRADGSITISLVAQAVKAKLRRFSDTKNTIIQTNITTSAPDTLQSKINKALSALSKNKHMKINGTPVSLEERQKAVAALTPAILEQFKATFRMPEHVRSPIPYLASALYQYTEQIAPTLSEAEPEPVSQSEILCLFDMISNKIHYAQANGNEIAEKDAVLVRHYMELNQKRMSISSEDYEQQCRLLFENWKNNG